MRVNHLGSLGRRTLNESEPFGSLGRRTLNESEPFGSLEWVNRGGSGVFGEWIAEAMKSSRW
jgi:hypothetical protein